MAHPFILSQIVARVSDFQAEQGPVRRGLSLLEMVIVCGLLALLLAVLGVTVRQFYCSRNLLAEHDQEAQLTQVLSLGVAQELRDCYDVQATSPDLILRRVELADSTRLPTRYPSPVPAPTPIWDPETSLVQVQFHFDAVNATLWRNVTFPDSRTSRQRLAEGIYGFTVSNSTAQDFDLTMSFQTSRQVRVLQQSVHHADR